MVNFNLCAREGPRVWMEVESVVSKEKKSNDVLFDVEGDFLIKMMYLIIIIHTFSIFPSNCQKYLNSVL